MSKVFSRLLVVLAFGWASSASAIPITDTVTVAGREWAQPADFTSLSWNAINSVCPSGVCVGTLTSDSGTWDMDGWLWAGLDAVNGLFNTYLTDYGVAAGDLLTGPDYFFSLGDTWTAAFFLDFDATTVQPFFGGQENYMRAWTSTLYPPTPNYAYYTFLTRAYDEGWYGVVDTSSPISTNNAIYVSTQYGAWFYRAEQLTPIPIPSTLFLLMLGLIGLRVGRS
jgi:hypothetical protein